MGFNENIFEAIVTEIYYNEGRCTLSPLSAAPDYIITDVPIPHVAGNGTSGIFHGIEKGTRVIAATSSGRGRESTVIVALVPKYNLFLNKFDSISAADIPSETLPYPDMAAGRIIMRGVRGSQLRLLENGNAYLHTIGGGGLYLSRHSSKTSATFISEDTAMFSNAGRSISGSVRRISSGQRNLRPLPNSSDVPLFADINNTGKTTSLGFFTGSAPLKHSYSQRKRNPELSEYRMVINEFSTDSMFTGFDDEILRVSKAKSLFDSTSILKRYREQSNSLNLAKHELIEIIGGNLVDISGNILDINLRKLSYGDPNNTIPSEVTISYDRARRISRRGIGYHFQLSTATKASDISNSKSNLLFDIDKEGLVKINIPASTNTGNIPFGTTAIYGNDDSDISMTHQNPSALEPIPVTLRNENGEIIFPKKTNLQLSSGQHGYRLTGIRHDNSEENPYFPSDNDLGKSDTIRINTTKYHNMYAAAERLIANTIKSVNIPRIWVDESGLPDEVPAGKPFEIAFPEELATAETSSSVPSNVMPISRSVVIVSPDSPAIDPGGDTIVAGEYYPDDQDNLPYSNSFKSAQNGNDVSAEISDNQKPTGGKSLYINFEGTIETSIGKDNYDQKSLILDTAGSIIAWLGKDKNNRSCVLQTDGDVLVNVGGSYGGTSETSPMNIGRLDIRVNITDKKFISTQFVTNETTDNGGSPNADSDIILSFSEKGIIIACAKPNVPMIIRNDADVLIESTSGDIILKGVEVKTIEPKGRPSTIRSAGR